MNYSVVQPRRAPASGEPAPTPRREFLGQLAATAVVFTAAACAAPLAASRPATPARPSPAPSPPSATDKQRFDDSWVSRLTARHKAVFDGPEISEGLALSQARTYMRNYHDMYDAADSEIQAVIVIRHNGIPVIAGDALWDRYELGKWFKLRDPATGKPARRNPFYKLSPDDKYAMVYADGTLDALRERGAILLGCNLAAMYFAGQIAARTKGEVSTIQQEVRDNLVPGALLMPSGIFAVMRAQEAGCTYIRSA